VVGRSNPGRSIARESDGGTGGCDCSEGCDGLRGTPFRPPPRETGDALPVLFEPNALPSSEFEPILNRASFFDSLLDVALRIATAAAPARPEVVLRIAPRCARGFPPPRLVVDIVSPGPAASRLLLLLVLFVTAVTVVLRFASFMLWAPLLPLLVRLTCPGLMVVIFPGGSAGVSGEIWWWVTILSVGLVVIVMVVVGLRWEVGTSGFVGDDNEGLPLLEEPRDEDTAVRPELDPGEADNSMLLWWRTNRGPGIGSGSSLSA